METFIHIGVDDTDSTRKGCTTYIAALLVEKLTRRGATFVDYPNLVRLNPNVPWKTRGNAAVCLRLMVGEDKRESLIEDVVETVEEEADLDFPKTDPGMVFYEGKEIPQKLTEFANTTIQRVVRRRDALRLIKHFRCEAIGFYGGRGLIGALAAVGEPLFGDHTYELIAYRKRGNRGTPRKVDGVSVFEMDERTRGLTFNNVDPEKKRVLITPRGPDPVLLGVRGENPEVLRKAFGMLRVYEEVERWLVFRTNQGTDAHLCKTGSVSQAHPYNAVIVSGSIVREPRAIPGKHVIFTISDESGYVDCAAYEPTGNFRNVVRELVEGDIVEVYGGVRPPSRRSPITINVEKMRIVKLVIETILRNPVCKICGKSMESMGRGKGFRCKKCGRRDRRAEKSVVPVERKASEKLYIPPPRAHRHLTKPWSRYGNEKGLEKYPLFPKDFWGLGNPTFQESSLEADVNRLDSITYLRE